MGSTHPVSQVQLHFLHPLPPIFGQNPRIYLALRLNITTRKLVTKFGQLILRNIIKIVATRCRILRLKCTKIDFGWGSAPDHAGGAYSAPQTP